MRTLNVIKWSKMFGKAEECNGVFLLHHCLHPAAQTCFCVFTRSLQLQFLLFSIVNDIKLHLRAERF